MSKIQELYRIENIPVSQNRMFPTEESAKSCTLGDMILVQDLETGLIFNQAFKPELIEYDSNYQNEQALSSCFKGHLNVVTDIIRRNCGKRSLLEVGCGKGYFLDHLQTMGFEIIGLDPIYEGSNPDIIKKYFTSETDISAENIILRHVLEHVPDPVTFLYNLRDSNKGKGTIYIEVPCFDWICKHCAWFDIYYEHLNYFRLIDLTRMFGHIYESGHIFNGQYLYIVANLATLRHPLNYNLNSFEFPSNFIHSIDTFAQKSKEIKKQQELTVIWGGASKGVIFALLMSRAGEDIDLAIDINPAKQGKFLPSTGIRVDSPSILAGKMKPGSEIFLMNSNYLEEVKQLTNNKFIFTTVDHDTI